VDIKEWKRYRFCRSSNSNSYKRN